MAIASRATVAAYLGRNYAIPEGTTAEALVEKHGEDVDHDAHMRSFDYWTGDNIARAEGLVPLDADDDEGDENDAC